MVFAGHGRPGQGGLYGRDRGAVPVQLADRRCRVRAARTFSRHGLDAGAGSQGSCCGPGRVTARLPVWRCRRPACATATGSGSSRSDSDEQSATLNVKSSERGYARHANTTASSLSGATTNNKRGGQRDNSGRPDDGAHFLVTRECYPGGKASEDYRRSEGQNLASLRQLHLAFVHLLQVL